MMTARTCRLVISAIVLTMVLAAGGLAIIAWPDAAKATTAAEAGATMPVDAPCAADGCETSDAMSSACHAACAGASPGLLPPSLAFAAPAGSGFPLERGSILDGREQRPDPAPPRSAA